jgi:small subunit ribosomal protein S6
MKRYEALMIFRAAGTEQELAQLSKRVQEVIQRLGGRVDRSEAFGRRRLAYRIGRQTEGQYHLLQFEAPTLQLGELERQLRLQDEIIRFMILGEDELALEPAGQATGSPSDASTRS